MIPGIDAVFETGTKGTNNNKSGINDYVVAMPHRGRLNFLVGLLQYPARDFFWKVQGNSEFPEGVIGSGDVLSHIGKKQK